MPYVRTEINLDTYEKCATLISAISVTTDEFYLVDEVGNLQVSPRSMLGVMYARADWSKVYLVNKTNDGQFPIGINDLRIF